LALVQNDGTCSIIAINWALLPENTGFLQGGRRKIVADEQRRCVGSQMAQQMAQQMAALSKLNNSRKL